MTGDIGTSILIALKVAVASWYYALRNFAALGLLCALIFNAIRILLSSVADEKAHYKMQLIDWMKAACLVIFVHLIMIFILNFCDILVEILANLNSRFSMLAYIRGKLFASWDLAQVGYLALYVMLTYYTLAFSISYSKRFLYTMILIVIAPIVSLLYAFGKQGKDIFNKWLKEFIYNAMLQPYHLLIYTVLFGWVAAILEGGSHDIAVVMYACTVAHFIKDAEKYYRSLFGMGQGVAGIGQFDTGDKVIKDVTKKLVETAKTVATTAAAIFIPGGAILKGAKALQMGSQAANAGKNASNLLGTAKQFKGVSPGGGNTPPRSGQSPFDGIGGGENPPVAPGGTSGSIPEANGVGNYKFSDSSYGAPYLDRNDNEHSALGTTRAQQNIEREQITNQRPVNNDSVKEPYTNRQATIQGPANISNLDDMKLDNGNSNLNVGQLNANEAKLGKVNPDGITAPSNSNRIEGDRRKIDARLEAGAIDKIVNTLTGKSHTSVLPGQAPSTIAEKGQDLGLKNAINTVDTIENAKQRKSIDENIETLEFEDNTPTTETLTSPSSEVMKAVMANEIIEGTKDSKNQVAGLNATVEQEANVSNNISASNSYNSSLEYKGEGDITKQIESVIKRNGGKINNVDELANRVAEKTGKSQEDVKRIIEGAYSGNGKAGNVYVTNNENINREQIALKGTSKSGSKDSNPEEPSRTATTSSSNTKHVEETKTQNLLEDNNTK